MESCVEGMETVGRKDAWNFWGSRSNLSSFGPLESLGPRRVDDPQFMPDNLEEKKGNSSIRYPFFLLATPSLLILLGGVFFDGQQLAPAKRHKGRQDKNEMGVS